MEECEAEGIGLWGSREGLLTRLVQGEQVCMLTHFFPVFYRQFLAFLGRYT